MALSIRLIASGSSGNATLVRTGRAAVLLDAGVSCRRLEQGCRAAGVEPDRLEAVILSHGHSDHAGGAPRFSDRNRLPVLCGDATHEMLGRKGKPLAAREPLPRRVEFSGLAVESFSVPHDAPNVGFRVTHDGVAVGLVTDLGRADETIARSLRGCHTLMIESNYDLERLSCGPYPGWLKERITSPTGHLSNEDASWLVARATGPETRRVVLVHLSEVNNHPSLARGRVEEALREIGREDVIVDVAGRNGLPEPLHPRGSPGPEQPQLPLEPLDGAGLPGLSDLEEPGR